ncbi:MAG: hypothetical protein ACOYL6_11195 [Bacteriovoracaceae bacterium]
MSESASNKSLETSLEVNYCKVPIKYLLQYADEFYRAEVFIKLGGEKYIKLTLREQGFVETLEAYQKKGLTDIFLTEADFKEIFTGIKNRLSHKQFYNPDTIQESKLGSLEQTFMLTKEFVLKFGIDQDVVDVLKSINIQTIRSLKQSHNIFAFFKDFRNNCSEEFLRNIMVNHLVMLMIDKFSWRSAMIKEKATMASLLCDVTMTKEDFEEMKKCDLEKIPYPEHIKKHPIKVTEILREKKEIVSMETITIIEQHHEKSDGTGFPYGHNFQRINQLSAIYITAAQFMDLLISSDFDYEEKDNILDQISSQMRGGAFDKAIESLRQVTCSD